MRHFSLDGKLPVRVLGADSEIGPDDLGGLIGIRQNSIEGSILTTLDHVRHDIVVTAPNCCYSMSRRLLVTLTIALSTYVLNLSVDMAPTIRINGGDWYEFDAYRTYSLY